jgi:hypothetical protein
MGALRDVIRGARVDAFAVEGLRVEITKNPNHPGNADRLAPLLLADTTIIEAPGTPTGTSFGRGLIAESGTAIAFGITAGGWIGVVNRVYTAKKDGGSQSYLLDYGVHECAPGEDYWKYCLEAHGHVGTASDYGNFIVESKEEFQKVHEGLWQSNFHIFVSSAPILRWHTGPPANTEYQAHPAPYYADQFPPDHKAKPANHALKLPGGEIEIRTGVGDLTTGERLGNMGVGAGRIEEEGPQRALDFRVWVTTREVLAQAWERCGRQAEAGEEQGL